MRVLLTIMLLINPQARIAEHKYTMNSVNSNNIHHVFFLFGFNQRHLVYMQSDRTRVSFSPSSTDRIIIIIIIIITIVPVVDGDIYFGTIKIIWMTHFILFRLKTYTPQMQLQLFCWIFKSYKSFFIMKLLDCANT